MEIILVKSLSKHAKFIDVLKQYEQPIQLDLHAKVTNNIDYSLIVQQPYIFHQIQPSFATHVGFRLNSGFSVPKCIKEESEIMENVYTNIQNYSYNTQTLSKLLVIRNPFFEKDALRKSESAQKYLEFIKDLWKHVYNLKEKHLTSFEKDVQDIGENIESILNDRNKLLAYDLLNDSILATTISFYEIFDRLTDSEDIQNCIILSSHNFFHPLNWILSPAAWAIAFFNSQIIQAKKPKREESFYSKSTLPRVTYLNLTGIISEMDINVLHHSSENIQTITIYDENTGGPNILRDGHLTKSTKPLDPKKNFQEISDKNLLLPLRCSKGDNAKRKEYSSNDLLQLIEYAVVPSVSKFAPAYIVLNVSLIFDEESNTPFALNSDTLGYLVHLLTKMSDSKVLVYPFKLPNMKDLDTDELFTKIKEHSYEKFEEKKEAKTEEEKKKEEQRRKEKKEENERKDYILKRYGVPYNQLYLRNSIIKIFEVLSSQYDLALFDRLKRRKDDKINPTLQNMCYQIGRFYKTHPYYKFLYSKSLNTLSQVAFRGLVAISDETPEIDPEMTNSVILHFPGKPASKIILKASSGAQKEILLTKNSQYLVDYNQKEVPTLYVFNARTYEKDQQYGLKTFGDISDFSAHFEMEEQQWVMSDFTQISMKGNEEEEMMKDCGLCKCDNFIFRVYGTNINKNEESNRIQYTDFETGEKFSIGLNEQQKKDILPRHSATACAFKRDNKYYLYVFGGQIRSNVTWKDKNYGSLDIFDFVEVYQTDEPRSGSWEYKLLPKENNISADKAISFIPFYQSFACYDELNQKILLIGGKTFESSVYNWTCPVFEFDTVSDRFISFQLFLNHIKDNPNRKRIHKSLYSAPFMTTAIASPNRNIYYDEKEKAYKVIIPLDYEDIVCVYTCDPVKGRCDYGETQIQPTVIKVKGTLLEKTITSHNTPGKRPLLINPRVATLLNYSFPFLMHRKIVLELTKWRLKKDEEILTNQVIDEEWKRIIARIRKEAQKSTADEAEMNIKIMDWSSFREFEDIFMKRDNRLEKLREYLTIQICLSILKTLEDILTFREFTEYIADKISGRTKKKQDDSFSKSISTASTMDSSNTSLSSRSLGEDEAKEFKKKTAKLIMSWIKKLERYRDTKNIDKIEFDSLVDQSTELESTIDTLESVSKIDQTLSAIYSSEMQGYKGGSQPQEILESMSELGKDLKRRMEYNLRMDPSNLNRIINELRNLLVINKDFFAIDSDPNNIFDETPPSRILEQNINKCIEILKECFVKDDSVIIEEGGKSFKLIESLTSANEQPRIQFIYQCFIKLQDFILDKKYNPDSVIEEGRKLTSQVKEEYKMKELIESLVGILQVLKDSKEVNKALIKNLISTMEPIVQSAKLHDDSTRADSMIEKDNSSMVSEGKRTGGQEVSSTDIISSLEESKENIKKKEKSKVESTSKRVPEEEEKHEIQAAVDTSSYIHNQSLSLSKRENPLDQSMLPSNKNILSESVLIDPSEQVEKAVTASDLVAARPFQECLSSSSPYRTILNGPRSEIILSVEEELEYKLKSRLRFAVPRIDSNLQIFVLETFSLDHSPTSIYVMGDAVICYLDRKTKTRYPDLYGEYGCWILYADLTTSLVPSPYGENVKFLVFKKLFRVTQDDQIFQRSLVVTDKYICLFGGKSMKKKNNTITHHKEILIYSLEKYQDGQVDSNFKISDVDKMIENSGECTAIAYQGFIYVCKRENPQKMEIFSEDGLREEEEEEKDDDQRDVFDSYKNHTVNMSLVKIKDKVKIMLTFSLKDQDRKFMLFDIEKKILEEEKPKLKQKEKEKKDEVKFLCSGFEEFNINSSAKDLINEVLLYNNRDTEQINAFNIETT